MKNLLRYLSVLLIFVVVASCGGGGGGGGGGAATGTAILDWTAPTQYDDGSPLNGDLAGYKVKYGTAPGTYTHTIDVPDAAALSYAVTDLPAGTTYYFVVTAYNKAGNESDPSNEANKKI